MANFHLEIVSMDGQKFDDEVERISLRTITGDLAIMAHHINYCTAVGMGTAKVIMKDGSERKAACIGGMLSMMDNHCRLIPTTFEWSEEIDVDRAERAKERAEKKIQDEKLSEPTTPKKHYFIKKLYFVKTILYKNSFYKHCSKNELRKKAWEVYSIKASSRLFFYK